MHLRRTLIALFTTLMLSLPAWALELDDAKRQGLVGETANGYLAAIKSSAEVDALVKDINSKRKTSYQRIAEKNGISRAAVEARAGERAISLTPAGQYVNPGNGWQKK